MYALHPSYILFCICMSVWFKASYVPSSRDDIQPGNSPSSVRMSLGQDLLKLNDRCTVLTSVLSDVTTRDCDNNKGDTAREDIKGV